MVTFLRVKRKCSCNPFCVFFSFFMFAFLFLILPARLWCVGLQLQIDKKVLQYKKFGGNTSTTTFDFSRTNDRKWTSLLSVSRLHNHILFFLNSLFGCRQCYDPRLVQEHRGKIPSWYLHFSLFFPSKIYWILDRVVVCLTGICFLEVYHKELILSFLWKFFFFFCFHEIFTGVVADSGKRDEIIWSKWKQRNLASQKKFLSSNQVICCKSVSGWCLADFLIIRDLLLFSGGKWNQILYLRI